SSQTSDERRWRASRAKASSGLASRIDFTMSMSGLRHRDGAAGRREMRKRVVVRVQGAFRRDPEREELFGCGVPDLDGRAVVVCAPVQRDLDTSGGALGEFTSYTERGVHSPPLRQSRCEYIGGSDLGRCGEQLVCFRDEGGGNAAVEMRATSFFVRK